MSPPHKPTFKLICPKNATLRNLHGKGGDLWKFYFIHPLGCVEGSDRFHDSLRLSAAKIALMQSNQEEVPATWQGIQGGASWETLWLPIPECLSGKGNEKRDFLQDQHEYPERPEECKALRATDVP